MPIHSRKQEVWSLAETFLDLFQEKLLRFQKYYDLAVSEREALESEDIEELTQILNEKKSVQKETGAIDREVERIQAKLESLITGMDKDQTAELKDTVNLLVTLLQKIIDYEERSKFIAIQQKTSLLEQMQEVVNGDKMLKGYFTKKHMSPKYINQAR